MAGWVRDVVNKVPYLTWVITQDHIDNPDTPPSTGIAALAASLTFDKAETVYIIGPNLADQPDTPAPTSTLAKLIDITKKCPSPFGPRAPPRLDRRPLPLRRCFFGLPPGVEERRPTSPAMVLVECPVGAAVGAALAFKASDEDPARLQATCRTGHNSALGMLKAIGPDKTVTTVHVQPSTTEQTESSFLMWGQERASLPIIEDLLITLEGKDDDDIDPRGVRPDVSVTAGRLYECVVSLLELRGIHNLTLEFLKDSGAFLGERLFELLESSDAIAGKMGGRFDVGHIDLTTRDYNDYNMKHMQLKFTRV